MYNRLFPFLFVAALVSCDNENENEVKDPVLNVHVETGPAENAVIVTVADPPTFPVKPDDMFFHGDWEALETMPVPDGSPAIPTPWSDGTHRKFSDDIRYDYKKSDGWEWATGSFSNTVSAAHNYFMLYNVYRGVLRFYYYIDNGTQNVRDHQLLAYRLATQGPSAGDCALLNFAGQDIVDVDTHSRFASKLESWPIDDKSWYVMEFEMAFDPTLPAYMFEDLWANWSVAFQKMGSLRINNVAAEKLPSAFQQSGIDIFDGLVWNVAGEVDLIVSGKDEYDDVAPMLSSADAATLSQVIRGNLDSPFLNGYIPDTNRDGYPTTVHWRAYVNLSKTSNVGVVPLNFALPGQDNSAVPGTTPRYNVPMGVFNLDRRPLVRYAQTSDPAFPHAYRLDAKTVRYMFNPILLKRADVTNIRQEIVATESSDLIKDFSQTKFYRGQMISSNAPLTIQGVRVSFDVVPKDGGPVISVVKTFKADVAIN